MEHITLTSTLLVVGSQKLLCLAETSAKAGSHTLDTIFSCKGIVAVLPSACNTGR